MDRSITEVELPNSTVVLDLEELAAKYAELVPFRFRVVNGFLAENMKDPTLGVDEVYSVHLVKERKVVSVKSTNGEFYIPVNSAAKFGIIHNKQNETFETVHDVLNSKPRPPVIAVRSIYLSPDRKLSLGKNDVLIVKEAARGKLGRANTGLRVFSVASQKEIVLPKDCNAKFTTDPHHTQLYLTDLLDHAKDFMPCSVKMYPNDGSSLAKLFTSEILTIEKEETHRSVLVSLFRDNPASKRKRGTVFIDIPTTININVRIIKTETSDGTYQHICQESQDLLNEYNPLKIQVCIDAHTDDDYMTQAQLLAEIRKEKEKRELVKSAPQQYQSLLRDNISSEVDTYDVAVPLPEVKPPSILPKKPFQPPSTNSMKKSSPHIAQKPVGLVQDVLKLGNSERRNEKPARKLPPPPPLTETKKVSRSPPVIAKKTKHLYEDITHHASTLSSADYSEINIHSDAGESGDHNETRAKLAAPQHTSYVKFSKPHSTANESSGHRKDGEDILSNKIDDIQKTLSNIMNQMSEIQSRQSYVETQLKTVKTPSITEEDMQETPTVCVGMKITDVLKALNKIKLPQYKEAFSQEMIDGELFMILDEETLVELGVTSKLHRIRILKLKKSDVE